jgi:hypothetical protein
MYPPNAFSDAASAIDLIKFGENEYLIVLIEAGILKAFNDSALNNSLNPDFLIELFINSPLKNLEYCNVN